MYLKTLLTKIMIEDGKLLIEDKNPRTSNFIEMKIKVPAHVAKSIVECSKCFAKSKKLEELFDIFCTMIFQEGLFACTAKEFENKEAHTDFTIDILKNNKQCGNCFKRIFDEYNISAQRKSP